MIMDPMRIELNGYAVLEKIATKQGNSAHVTVPIAWLGKRVRVVLVEPLDHPE
jgi:putative transposon-encoded protein